MCNCSGRHTSACISEFICPACGSVWRRAINPDKSDGGWIKRQNKRMEIADDGPEPDDTYLDERDEPWTTIPG